MSKKWSKAATKQLLRLSLLLMPFLLRGDLLVPPLVRLKGSSSSMEVAEVLKRDGVVVLESRSDAETVRAAFKELEQGRMAAGQSVRFGDSTQLLKRPLDPLEEPALSKLAKDPLILAAAELARQEHGEGSHHSIAWEVRLLILSSGMPEGDMHRDVVDTSSIPLKRPLQWGLNTIWAVDDFTQENGATRFVPGSHSSAAPQGHWLGDRVEAALSARAAEMRPGSVVIYYASTLHGSGENQSPAARTGLNFNYAFVDEAGGRPFDWGY